MTTATCPSCGHSDRHSGLAGCLWSDGEAFCTCTARWAAPKSNAVAIAERDEALARVAEHTDPSWEAEAVQAIYTLAARRFPDDNLVEFTTDDVWDLLAERGIPAPHEPRALGTIVREATRQGVIRVVGWAPSRRRHQSPIRVFLGVPE